jgi:hypothetical protein
MVKKIIKITGVVILLTVSVVVVYSYWTATKSYKHRQVKKIAPVSSSQALNINKHISEIARPVDTVAFPINLGETGPSNNLYSGPNQYPFYCMTLDSGLGQPLVDNQQGYGVPVYGSGDKQNKVIGFSKDCSVATRLTYFMIDNDRIKQLTVKQLQSQQSLDAIEARIFRAEQGTINRFIYTLIMPITKQEIDNRAAQSQWNKRLIYQFNGGSGIGYRQGRQTVEKVISRQKQQLLDGYAVISSSGNKTSYTYNMLLAEDTARRVKKQFTGLYGEPLYTVGIGGSGGGLAQYLIGQNSTGILDGLIPLYSYPDMITQTTYALDCDLLNNYFTFRAKDKTWWNDWGKRQLLEGMNAINHFPQKAGFLQPVNQIMAGFIPSFPKGNSECINGYFGLSSFINNPKQGFLRDFFHLDVVNSVNWSYWQDLVGILGQDKHGYGLSTWDNVGVQYGISALVDKSISIEEFIDVNRKIGSWKQQSAMKKESIVTPFGTKLPVWLSLWGNQNISTMQQKVAGRKSGSIAAMKAAYFSGQVFIGKIGLPIIDVRHYLEKDLDMHHVSASFYSRLRIKQQTKQIDNHIIWISHKNHSPVDEAFNMMDEWLLKLADQSLESVIAAKPAQLNDSCFSEDGELLYQGENVWDGDWNTQPTGKCQKVYPMYSTSRIQAGGTWAGDIFKCQLMPLEQAIDQGLYGDNNMDDYRQQLSLIFPQGVCDYSKPDLGRPDGL